MASRRDIHNDGNGVGGPLLALPGWLPPALERALCVASALWLAALTLLPLLAAWRGLLLVPAALVVACIAASVLCALARTSARPLLAASAVTLFGALCFQLHRAPGGPHFAFEPGVSGADLPAWQWAWFALSHAARGIDVLDVLHAYDVRLSPISPASHAARILILTLHFYILFFLAEGVHQVITAMRRRASRLGEEGVSAVRGSWDEIRMTVRDSALIKVTAVVGLAGVALFWVISSDAVRAERRADPRGHGQGAAALETVEMGLGVLLVLVAAACCAFFPRILALATDPRRTWRSRCLPYLAFVGVTLCAAPYALHTGDWRNWARWVVEAVTRMFDLCDLYEIYDLRLHAMPVSVWLGTGSVLLRLAAGLIIADAALQARAMLVRHRPPELLLGQLRDSDDDERERAANLLARHPSGHEVADELARLLADEDGRVRRGASAALEGLGERAVPGYIALLRGPDPELRELAAERLLALDGHAVTVAAELADLVQDEGTRDAAKAAALDVAASMRWAGVPVLTRLVRPDDGELSRRALKALFRLDLSRGGDDALALRLAAKAVLALQVECEGETREQVNLLVTRMKNSPSRVVRGQMRRAGRG